MQTKSAARTLDVFEAFARVRRPLTITDLARELNSPLSSCFQLARTLEGRGYLFSLGARRGVYPTKRMLHACEAISLHDPLQQLFAHSLDALRSGTNETAVLAQRVDKQVMVVDAQDSPERVRYTPEIGEFHELHSTAVGKAILGAMPDKLRVALIEALPLERFTHSTIVAGDKLEQELEEGRKRGWHVTRGENILDLCAIAAPVRVGGEIFALGLGGPYHRFITEVDRHAEVLLKVVRALEASQEAAKEG